MNKNSIEEKTRKSKIQKKFRVFSFCYGIFVLSLDIRDWIVYNYTRSALYKKKGDFLVSERFQEVTKKVKIMEEYQDRSLRGRVFEKLREDILSGVYKDCDELREITIGEEMGVSRTPVREALRQLELEGLVKIIPNKGAYVTGITPKDVQDIYMIRSMLEGMCARWATEHITPEQIEQLEEIVLLSEFHLKKDKDKVVQVSDLDGKFHHVLYEASNSRIMEHTLSDFHKYVKMARMLSVGAKNRAEKSIEEHKAILEAIKKGDADEAERLANLHIMHVMENLHIEFED